MERVEENHAMKDSNKDAAWIIAALKKDPRLILTVKAVAESKARGRGERLYRGDRTLGTLAQKHSFCCLALAHMTQQHKTLLQDLKTQ